MRHISSILICVAISVFLWKSIDIGTYRQYHAQSPPYSNSQERTFLDKINIIASPRKEDWLLQYIDNADREIKVAIYMFTVPSLREALLRAKKRWVDVKILLEGNPYNATGINRETVVFFEKNGLNFSETQTQYFSFMHAKYMIIDDIWIIATANWTRSSFSSNREFFVVGQDIKILQELRKIFDADFSHKVWVSDYPSIIIWPTNTRDKLVNFIQSADKEIHLYMPSLTDIGIIEELHQACSENKEVSILLDQENQKDNDWYNKDIIVKKGCPKIRIMKKPSLHAKVLIVDKSEAFLGSFNFTENSLENNREIGIFINGKTVSEIVNIFYQDWVKSVDF